MLHRFQDDSLGIVGHKESHLRQSLRYLVENKFELVGLSELFRRLAGEGPPLRGAVAFTIDDGYFDQATVAAPVFADFQCPVTTFVSTGFLDGKTWFWWDQIEHVFEHAVRRHARLYTGASWLQYQWESVEQRRQTQDDFISRCKRMTDDAKWAAIAELAKQMEVEIPRLPPARYAPMTWAQLRVCEDLGMTFGPHTVTHPILSRTTDEHSEWEITESWSRLRAEARRPLRIFCYPNGGWDDFGVREVRTLERIGFDGAVVGVPGYAKGSAFHGEQGGRFRLRRFGLPEDVLDLAQYVSGAERIKQVLRRLRAKEAVV